MELFERENYFDILWNHYQRALEGKGHTLFITGDAGIGKSSLVNHFISRIDKGVEKYLGACDSLFTPRPLGPLFDIVATLANDFSAFPGAGKSRSSIFSWLVQKIAFSEKPVVLVFEDIHWADEGTLDLIKFLARRIFQYRCLFVLTYRDNEVGGQHKLATIFGELQSAHFSEMQLKGFSANLVNQLATSRGHASGSELFNLTGGNPFYVIEILTTGDARIPKKIKDSILSTYRSKEASTKSLLEFLSILPSRIDFSLRKKIESEFPNEIEVCISSNIIVKELGYLRFKHELFRLTIEESLTPEKRKQLHKKILHLLPLTNSGNLSQVIHHAKYAEEPELIREIAPIAADQAASMGSHVEASKLYMIAIEFTNEQDPSLVELYEKHAYECYLTNQIPSALASQEIALKMLQNVKAPLKEGNALRFLSRLHWIAGDHSNSIETALRAIKILEKYPTSREAVLAYSNYSYLSMYSDDPDNAIVWGRKAINLAVQKGDREIECSALNSIGSTLLKIRNSELKGERSLNKSLTIALEEDFHEHAARAYTNLAFLFVLTRKYKKAKEIFETGLAYCEERDLSSWKYYILICKALAFLETGHWAAADKIARNLQSNANSHIRIPALATLARVSMRKGRFQEAANLIKEAKKLISLTQEPQRVIQLLTAELEFCWITQSEIQLKEVLRIESTLFRDKNYSWHYTELSYWMDKCQIIGIQTSEIEFTTPFALERLGSWDEAAMKWAELGCPYEQALALFNSSNESHQKEALVILKSLGATATYDLLRDKLKLKGVTKIPRGPRDSTRNNPLRLTNRQVEILFLIQTGATNKEIGNKLFISPKTVNHHLTALFRKLVVHSRSEAVQVATQLEILK